MIAIMELLMELHQLLVRIDPAIVEAIRIIKQKERRSMAAIVEDALRDYLAKRGVHTEQPSADV
jgi:hypothetical protein